MLGKSEFVRSHGLGNDYLVVDGSTFGVPLTEENIRRICDRHSGVGSDGILELVAAPEGFDAALRIYNPDGSEAEKSGNGVRIFAKFCFDHQHADPVRPLRIHTLGGAVRARLVAREPDRSVLRVEMGRASFRCADLPMTGADEWIERRLEVGGVSLNLTCVSMGNPHAVVLDAEFDEATVKRLGPLLESHPRFPNRTNVQFARVLDRATVEAHIWERGAGWTLSSGSSSCAVAAACVRTGRTDRTVDVVMPGGTLGVTISEDWNVEQIGWAQEVARGVVSSDLLSALEKVG
jgi:diaminopimelate epimerase